jgi:hypothetical protein
MALTQTRLQVRDNVRRTTDTRGANALVRHPDTDLNEYINRGYAALYRKLTVVVPDQRFLSTSTISTVSGTTTYSLPADFDHLISIDMLANGVLSWLTSFEMPDRPGLASASASGTGIPTTYRLRGSNIEVLPTPASVYTITLWYVPNTAQFTADNNTFDTIVRLDDYVISYASLQVAVRDKNWPLVGECRTAMAELDPELEAIARSRDKNSPSRIVDEQAGQFRRRRRVGWRR